MPSLPRPYVFVSLLGSMFLIVAALLLISSFQNVQRFPALQHHPHIAYKEGLATNWAGYASATTLASPQTNSVSDVKASWVVPTLNCSDRRTAYSAAWTGIDGYTSATVEQLGTEQDCYRGKGYYSAWYEIYPNALVTLSMTIKPGNHISAEVKYKGSNQFLLTMHSGTQSFSTIQTTQADRSSAEWIVEAPSTYWDSVLPLTNFGTAHFLSASTTISGHVGLPTDAAWQYDPLTMVTWFGTVKAFPSTTTTGGAFDVTWNHR